MKVSTKGERRADTYLSHSVNGVGAYGGGGGGMG